MTFKRVFICFILVSTPNICIAQIGLQKCDCVDESQCFPNLQVDGRGQLDIRIVNNNQKEEISETCANGLIACCTECGIRYKINTTGNLRPVEGQAFYGSQPWQALLLDNDENYLGGGVLLDSINVLTAAHKIYAYRNAPGKVTVYLGEWDANNDVEPYKPQYSSVSKIFIHEKYVDSLKNLVNDIAILRLNNPIMYGPAVNPAINTACLPNATMNYEKIECVVSGWGKNAFNGTYQNIIKEVNVAVVNDDYCQQQLRKTKLGDLFVLNRNSFICAGGEEGKDACTGDGGSPLMCYVNKRYQVVGLVAWGIGCANNNTPGVYVRVQSFLSWINEKRAA